MQRTRMLGVSNRYVRVRIGSFSTDTHMAGKATVSSVRRCRSRRRTVAVATASAVVALGLLSADEESALYPIVQQNYLLLRSGWLLGAVFVTHTDFQRDLFGQTHENEEETRAKRRIQWWEALGNAGSSDTGVQERLVRVIANLLTAEREEMAEETRQLVDLLVKRGALSVLIDYVAQEQPGDPVLLHKIAGSLVVGLEATMRQESIDTPSLSLTALGVTLDLVLGNDVMQYSDLIKLGELLLQFQTREAEDGIESTPTQRFTVPHAVHRGTTRAIAGYQRMLSPELPPANKEFAVTALNQLARSALRHPDYAKLRQLDALLSPQFTALLFALPRGNLRLQQRAAALMATLLDAAQASSVPVSDEVYELWLQQIRLWMDASSSSELQLVGASCLRTLSSHPRTQQIVRESQETMDALFSLARHLHEDPSTAPSRRRRNSSQPPLSAAYDQPTRVAIQKHVSRTFRDICTSVHSGETAMLATVDSSLHSRRSLPMSSVFRATQDLTDLPVIGADEYEASTELGWADILTKWTGSSDSHVRANAIASLVHLIEHDSDKQQHLLQAWLTSLLQHVRHVTGGGEILAIKQVEDIARISDELTPGNENVLFNPAVVDAGASAVAVLAEQHYDELIHYGVVPLMALLAAKCPSSDSYDFHVQSARVVANLVAACCQPLEGDKHPLWQASVTEAFDIEAMLKQTSAGQWLLETMHAYSDRQGSQQRSQLFRAVANLAAYRQLATTGSRTLPVYAEGVHPIVACGSAAVEDETDVDVIFIHGLRGSAFGTWRTDMGDAMDAKADIWPDILLHEDLQTLGVRSRVLSLGYEAGMVSWSSPWPSLTLEERAKVMLQALYEANVGSKPVVFITHSMGGILAKKMLLQSTADSRNGRATLAQATRGVVFLAVPHFGSDLARGVRSEAVRSLLRTHPAIQDLCASHDRRLESLNESFAELHIDALSIAEQKPAPLGFGLSAVVVKPESANPGVGEFFVLPSADHMTICKAKSREDPMYASVLGYVQRQLLDL